MLNWLLKFLLCVLVVFVVVYVCRLLLPYLGLPAPIDTIVMLIVGVAALIVVIRYLGYPPGSNGP